jgi:hypothetical protein
MISTALRDTRRRIVPAIQGFIPVECATPMQPATSQGRLDLTINASKTRTVKLNEPGATLDILGYTFRYDRDLNGNRAVQFSALPVK